MPESSLQRRIDRTCEFYRSRGWGKIKRVADPMTYMGLFQRIPLVFEANSVPGDQFRLSMIRPSRRLVEEYTGAGATGFILIEFTLTGEVFAATLDWLELTAQAMDSEIIPMSEFQFSEGSGRGLKQVTPGMCGVPVPFGMALESLTAKERRRASA